MVVREMLMSINVGAFDRIARIAIGIALIAFALGYIAPGTGWNWVGWIGVVLILTALFGTCPAYSLFGLSTR
jgi:sulfite exporter TauE/SafE